MLPKGPETRPETVSGTCAPGQPAPPLAIFSLKVGLVWEVALYHAGRLKASHIQNEMIDVGLGPLSQGRRGRRACGIDEAVGATHQRVPEMCSGIRRP
jgi:hypothetical protein